MDRAAAWLFSNNHLSQEELREAARRIRAGEQPDPSEKLLNMARDEIRKRALTQTTDQAMAASSLVGISALSLLLTPLAGFAFWWGYRSERPAAAAQILRVTWPIAIGFMILWGGVISTRLFG